MPDNGVPFFVTLLRLERRTWSLEASRSIQLSYRAKVVGAPRFELGISCSQSRRDNRASLCPVVCY